MKSQYTRVKEKADALFKEASFISTITSDREYHKALSLMDELVENYESNKPLIEILSSSINAWEKTSEEFSEFNRSIAAIDGSEALLRTLMEQHKLGVSDLPEIGSKSLVSKILNKKRRLTKDHIEALCKRFQISPLLFFN